MFPLERLESSSNKGFTPFILSNIAQGVDSLPLSIITPEALRQWQTAYVKSRGTDQKAIRSGKISANTILGSAARMFTPIMLSHYKDAGQQVPGNPFAEVKPFPKQDSRYISRIRCERNMAASSPKARASMPPRTSWGIGTSAPPPNTTLSGRRAPLPA